MRLFGWDLRQARSDKGLGVTLDNKAVEKYRTDKGSIFYELQFLNSYGASIQKYEYDSRLNRVESL